MGPKPAPPKAAAKAQALALADEQYMQADVAYVTAMTQLEREKRAATAAFATAKHDAELAKAKAYAAADQHGLPYRVPPKCSVGTPALPPKDWGAMRPGERKANIWADKAPGAMPQNVAEASRLADRNTRLVKACHKAGLSSISKYRRLSNEHDLMAGNSEDIISRVIQISTVEQGVVDTALGCAADSMP
eukprot:GEMP01041556.1.p1 GENE.GEMP01041556.1~~GEMP01041556.1.p1  ORF type:complete len:190 (+),score=46.33 GEMP01041556.1:102-671(+)